MASAVLLHAAVSSAGDPKTDADTDEARQLFDAAVILYKNREWDRARVKFQAAWALKKHYQIAAQLGDCELQLGRFREAAEHLDYAIRKGPAEGADETEMKDLRAAIAKAREKVGTLTIRVDRPGADVLLDGAGIGTSPLDRDIFVDPGTHKVAAKVPGMPAAESSVDVGAGAAQELSLKIEETTPNGDTTTPGGGSSLRVPLAIGAGALSAVALGTGIVLRVVSGGKASDADVLVADIEKSGTLCPNAAQASKCSEIADLRKSEDTFANVGLASIVGGAVLAGATIGILVFWPRAETRVGLVASPSSLHLTGTF